MDARSEQNLVGVHPDLCSVMRTAALGAQPFIVIHGLRTVAEEAQMVAKGASQTMHSRHLPNKKGFGCAVDVAAMNHDHVSWDAPLYTLINDEVQKAATALNIPVEWGGVWRMRDLGHFQLSWAAYP